MLRTASLVEDIECLRTTSVVSVYTGASKQEKYEDEYILTFGPGRMIFSSVYTFYQLLII